MSILVVIAILVVLVPLAGIGYAAFEKFLNHRAEIARIKYGSQSQSSAKLVGEIEQLREEVEALRQRLDEQAILLDDVQRLSPKIEQRLNG